jgi:hypothetical protein
MAFPSAEIPTPSDTTVIGPTPNSQWTGDQHPFAGLTPTRTVAAAEPAALTIPPIPGGAAPPEQSDIPAPVQQAIAQGKPIQFTTAADNAASQKQPDYFMTPGGKLVANPKATPSADGSINIQMQPKDQKDTSLKDAILHETDMQKQAANEMIRLFKKAHPDQAVPSWMTDLANAQPNLPDFVQQAANPQTATAPPADVSPPPPQAAPPPDAPAPTQAAASGPSGSDQVAGPPAGSAPGTYSPVGHHGFDNSGYYRGGSDDAPIWTGRHGDAGAPIGPGEEIKAKDVYDFCTQQGFTPAQASGILGNMQIESHFQTAAHNDREGAIGICQWEGPRRVELEAFAREQNKPVTDVHVQLDFMMYEFHHKYAGAYEALKHAGTPEQAAYVFQSQYEQSKNMDGRAESARHFYASLGNTEHPPQVASNATPTDTRHA